MPEPVSLLQDPESLHYLMKIAQKNLEKVQRDVQQFAARPGQSEEEAQAALTKIQRTMEFRLRAFLVACDLYTAATAAFPAPPAPLTMKSLNAEIKKLAGKEARDES